MTVQVYCLVRWLNCNHSHLKFQHIACLVKFLTLIEITYMYITVVILHSKLYLIMIYRAILIYARLPLMCIYAYATYML